MTKLQLAIYIDSERLRFLEEIQKRFHQKNLSTSLEIVFKHYESMADQLNLIKKASVTNQETPILPTTEAIQKEKIKDDPTLAPKWKFLRETYGKAKPEDPNLKSKVKYKK